MASFYWSKVAAFALLAGTAFACASDVRADDDGCGDDYDPIAYSKLALVTATPGAFTFVAFDVGQGDAAVAITPSGCAALFDGGPTGAGTSIKTNLRALGVTRIDAAFVSHFHADHLGAIDEVEQGTDAVPITTVYDRGGSYSSVAFTDYAARYAGRRLTPAVGDTVSLCNGEASVRIVAVNANGMSTSDENAKSLVVKVSFGDFDALVGGDLTGSAPDVESALTGAIGEVELYKVHHHGSAYSSNAAFLGALRPTVSLISVGASNSYGHPAPEALQRLAAVASAVWMTEDPATGTKRGHVTVTTTTGREFTVEQSGSTTTYASKAPADTTPPSTPATLAATATAPDRIDLAWSPSTDDVGVERYRIERSTDGIVFSSVGDAPASASAWTDTTVAAATTYSYRIFARDDAGNESGASPIASATTPAVVPPPPPPPSCDVAITSQTWQNGKRELAVRATSTQANAILSLSADGTVLGTMTYDKGSYLLRRKLASQPACVRVTADCGGIADACF